VLLADLVEEPHLVADADTDERARRARSELVGSLEAQLGCAREHVGHRGRAFSRIDVARLVDGRLDAVDELGDGTLLDRVLAERGQDVRDVLHEGAVRPDDQDAAPRAPLTCRVEEPRRAMEPDRGLARPGPALDHERAVVAGT
jgi:hypothetical protein